MTPKLYKIELIIANQTYPKTIPPIKFGIKKTVRYSFVPLIVPVKSNANKNAKILIDTTETTVNLTVNQSALTNVGSAKAFL